MCGIIGFIGEVRQGQWRQTHDILRGLFVASEHRGRDATGFIAQTDPLDPQANRWTVTAKEPTQASQFVNNNETFLRLRRRRCSAFIGHVRYATHGNPKDNRNNHPFNGKRFSLVHNGAITNHVEIADKFSLKLTTACDSEVLLRVVEAEKHPAVGLSRCLREIDGTMAVAMYDRQEKMIWLARNDGRPLWLARMKEDKRWFFASTDSILLRAFRGVMGRKVLNEIDYLAPTPSGVVLTMSPSSSLIASALTG